MCRSRSSTQPAPPPPPSPPPPSAPGQDVIVTNPNGDASAAGTKFPFSAPANDPSVSGTTPANGAGNGALVTVNGNNFGPAYVGSTPLVTFGSATAMVCISSGM